ncbi:MAG: hypothetical protein IT439_09045 [Phycisphaerales bacterium]|nr:hypothetical protein [Phycisphaerales bacterium]
MLIQISAAAISANGQLAVNTSASSGGATATAEVWSHLANCQGDTDTINAAAQTSNATANESVTGTDAAADGDAQVGYAQSGSEIQIDVTGEASSSFVLCNGVPCTEFNTCASGVSGANIVFSASVTRRAILKIEITGITIGESPAPPADAFIVATLDVPGYTGYSETFYASSASVEFSVPICTTVTNASLFVEGSAFASLDWATNQPVDDSAAKYATSVSLTLVECSCIADWNCDGTLDATDFFSFLDSFSLGDPCDADLTGSSDPNDPLYGVPDDEVDSDDFYYYLDLFTAGCP